MGNLKQAPSSGSYTVEGEAFEMPTMLGLEVNNFGPISLPLMDPQASNLIKICKQAPFGKHEKTLLDKNVRDSFQLEPDQIKINNPEWNVKLKDLLKRISKGLGCSSQIEVIINFIFLF